MKLGFIGSGKMATALAQGVLSAGICQPGDVTVSDAIPAAADRLAKATGARAATNAETVAVSDVVVLAVKPGDAVAALQSLSGGSMESTMRWAWKSGSEAGGAKLLLSIVAGLPLEKLEAAAGPVFRVIRAMPNTPALIMRGATGFARGSLATDDDGKLASTIFGSAGVAVEVKENLLDAVTGLSGSGPAYAYTIIEALADGGVLMGLPRELALRLAAQTLAGAAEMVLKQNVHPAVLRDEVTSPGGTTIAGLEVLEQRGLRSALIGAVRAATERAAELGRSK
jgi:pyrroline-5-carboxylate reductase